MDITRCYSTKLNLYEVHINDIFIIDISNIEITIKINKILENAVILTFINQKLIISVKRVKLQIVVINNILYFLLENKPIFISQINSDIFDIKSNLEFIPDECLIIDVLLLINPKSSIIPHINLSGDNWIICFHNKQSLDKNTFILKEDNIYYCNNKEELIKVIDHNDNVNYVISC